MKGIGLYLVLDDEGRLDYRSGIRFLMLLLMPCGLSYSLLCMSMWDFILDLGEWMTGLRLEPGGLTWHTHLGNTISQQLSSYVHSHSFKCIIIVPTKRSKINSKHA